METTYDRTADAAYVRFGGGSPAQTIGVGDFVNLDMDADGNLVGVEILRVSRQFAPEALAEVTFRDLVEEGGSPYAALVPDAERVRTGIVTG